MLFLPLPPSHDIMRAISGRIPTKANYYYYYYYYYYYCYYYYYYC